MEYKIIKVDTKEIEYNYVNCDTCKIFLNGFLIGRYNITKNEYTPAVDNWFSIEDYFKKLTQRQQKIVLINANKYFYNIYKKIYYDKLKNGEFFAPAEENLKEQLYCSEKMLRCENNILNIKNEKENKKWKN